MGEKFLRLEQHLARGRGREGEVDHGVDVHAFHLKNYAIDRHTEDFGFAELVKVVLEHGRGIESVAMAGASSPSTARSLGCRSFRDPVHLEGLNPIVQVVASLRKWVRSILNSVVQITTSPPLPSHSPPHIGYSGW